jgi:LysM repeat protein
LRTEFGQLQFFNPTPDEFRAVFRATDNFDQRIQFLADSTDANTVQARKALEDQREYALKLALGPKRYEEYRLLHDPLYRDAVAAAEQAGTPEAVRTLYAINQAAAGEQQSIVTDTNLTAEQRNIALKSLQLDQLKANTLATGQELPPDPPELPAQPAKRTYTLRPGDTPAVVAMIYGVPESAIRAANPGLNLNRLRPGDSITLPRSALAPGPAPGAMPASQIPPPPSP